MNIRKIIGLIVILAWFGWLYSINTVSLALGISYLLVIIGIIYKVVKTFFRDWIMDKLYNFTYYYPNSYNLYLNLKRFKEDVIEWIFDVI